MHLPIQRCGPRQGPAPPAFPAKTGVAARPVRHAPADLEIAAHTRVGQREDVLRLERDHAAVRAGEEDAVLERADDGRVEEGPVEVSAAARPVAAVSDAAGSRPGVRGEEEGGDRHVLRRSRARPSTLSDDAANERGHVEQREQRALHPYSLPTDIVGVEAYGTGARR